MTGSRVGARVLAAARPASLVCAALFAVGCERSMPRNLGVVQGKLAPCSSAPHCVSSEEGSVAPIPYRSSREEARDRLVDVIRSMPRTKVVTVSSDYVHAEFTSRIFHFVDDVEFYLDDRDKVIQVRSSSRTGYYDWGVNKGRVDEIRKKFAAMTAGSQNERAPRPQS